ncbi:MAG: FAD-dependent oxidoreductase [Clostridia bacterium]|nr:FAD-dependent oxidoreductase [Clostridia bacterium]
MINCESRSVVVIGGGPAGLSAAIAAFDAGAKDVLVLERDTRLGGILNQCIHNGFGLTLFKSELTGPEYAARLIDMASERGIECRLNTTVVSVAPDKTITCVSEEGVFSITADAIVLTCGCRERPRGAIGIAGARCAGVYTAGTAQKLVNIMGYMAGRECVILGSGDIGLIMARRMTLQGAKVRAVLEIMPRASGLMRNVVQCLNDYDIPLMTSHTVVDVLSQGGRVSGVVAAKVDNDMRPIAGSEFLLPCDTLLLSVGLIPETELAREAGIGLHRVTGGAEVDDTLMSNIDGIFCAGNMLHVHDLADYACLESEVAGKRAAEYAINGGVTRGAFTSVECGDGIRYAVPMKILSSGSGSITFTARPSAEYALGRICIEADGEEIYSKREAGIRPATMLRYVLNSAQSDKLRSASRICIKVRE